MNRFSLLLSEVLGIFPPVVYVFLDTNSKSWQYVAPTIIWGQLKKTANLFSTCLERVQDLGGMCVWHGSLVVKALQRQTDDKHLSIVCFNNFSEGQLHVTGGWLKSWSQFSLLLVLLLYYFHYLLFCVKNP